MVADSDRTPESQPERTFENHDGTSESWWRERHSHYRGVDIQTRVKTKQSADGALTDQDVSVSISDGHSPRSFSVPISVLDEVIEALELARDDATSITELLAT